VRVADKLGWVYIMANRKDGQTCVGATSDLPKRAREHRNGVVGGYTRRFGCRMLVWFQDCRSIEGVRIRKAQMKKWKRAWKIREVEGSNPEWRDLYDSIALG
jgi:putative endonuclease